MKSDLERIEELEKALAELEIKRRVYAAQLYVIARSRCFTVGDEAISKNPRNVSS